MIKVDARLVGVYRIRHIPSGSAYVGSSGRCIGNRLSWHRAVLRAGHHPSKRVLLLWQRSSESDWTADILELCSSDILKEREQYWAEQEKDLLNDHIPGRRRFSEDVKQRMREGRARYLETPGAREALAERARLQHEQKNFGAHTWDEGPSYSNVSREAGAAALRRHIAEQTPEEMSRRSLLRKSIGKESLV